MIRYHPLPPPPKGCGRYTNPEPWGFRDSVPCHSYIRLRLAQVHTRLAKVRTRFAKVHARLAKVCAWLAKVRAWLAKVRARLAKVLTRRAKVHTRFAKVGWAGTETLGYGNLDPLLHGRVYFVSVDQFSQGAPPRKLYFRNSKQPFTPQTWLHATAIFPTTRFR